MFLVFGHQACGILAPQLGIKPAPPALEGKVLTTGLPGKSPQYNPFKREIKGDDIQGRRGEGNMNMEVEIRGI